MERNQILDVLVKNLEQAVPEVKGRMVEPSQSMTEVGANSLDVVDVVSTTMRELQVKVPRDQLSKMQHVGELVDALYAAQAPPAPQ